MSILNKYQIHREENGFTLLELIISLTILTIIIVLVFSTIRIGIKAWETGNKRVDFLYRVKYLVDLMEKEIHSIHPYYYSKDANKKEKILAFQGSQNSIRFISSLDSSNPSSPGGLREISFYIEKNVENDKTELIMTERAVQSDRPFRTNNQKKARSVVLSSFISNIKFRYFMVNKDSIGKWLNSFTPGEGNSSGTKLPRAIEITLSVETDKKGINKKIEGFYLPPSIVLLNAGMEFKLNKKNKSL